MKNKIGKKILATFLSLLMVFTSLVFVVPEFNADASGDENATGVSSTNAAALNTIPAFDTSYTTIHGTFESDSDYLDQQYYDAIYHNVLYTDGSTTIEASASSAKTEYGNSWTGSNGVTVYWYHPTATLLYDGDTTNLPRLGVAVNTVMYFTGTWSRKTVNRLSYVSSGGNGFEFNQNWRGSDGRLNFNWMWHGQSEMMGYTSTVVNDGMRQTLTGNSDNHFYANLLKFTGSMSNTEYMREVQPTFGFYGDNGDNGKTITAKTTDIIRIINYVPLKAALNEALGTGTYSISTLKNNTSKYTTASVAEYVAAVKDLIAAKPNNYVNASKNDADGYATAASAAVTRFNNAKSGLTLAKYTVTFKKNDGSKTDYTYDYGTSVNCATLAASIPNSAVQISGDDANHQLYKWDTSKYVSSVVDDVTITEVFDKNVAHSFGAVAQNGATGHTWTCSACGYVKSGVHDNFTAWSSVDDSNHEHSCGTCGFVESATHNFGNFVDDENGTSHTKTCSLCNKSISGNHTWGTGVVTTQPGCATKGVRTYTCTTTGCGATYTEDIAPTGNHDYDNGEWVALNDTHHAKKCANCEAKTGESEHSFGAWVYDEASKTHKKTCATCSHVITDNADHVWNDGVVTTEPGCESTGIRTFTCTTCGATKEETEPQTGHRYLTYVSDNNATCEEDGTKTAECANGCGTKDTIADIDSALGHSYTTYIPNGDATCQADGTKTATCDNGCGKTDTVADTGSKLAHVFTAKADKSNVVSENVLSNRHQFICQTCNTAKGVVVDGVATINAWAQCSETATETVHDATCEEAGSIDYACTVCTNKWTVAGEAAKGHTEPADTEADAAYWEVVTEATCETAGSKKALCKVCGLETGTTAEIPATGHAYTSTVTTKATCFDDGVRTYTCPNANCEVPSYTETILKREHNYDKGVVTKPATFTEDGIMTYTCQNAETETHAACTHSYTEPIVAGEDSTAPEGEIKWGTTVWNSFLTAITFGKYTNYDVTLEISATDAESGVKSIEYFVSDKAYANADALEAEATWEEYKAASLTIPAADKETVVVYAKLTNNDEDVAYISTEDITFDMNAPVITVTGVGTGNVYCESATVSFSDDASGIDLDTRRIGYLQAAGYTWTEAEDILRDEPLLNVPGTYKVQVKDKAGNLAETEIVVQAHDFTDDTDTTEVVNAATCTTGTVYKVGCTNCDALSDTLVWEDDDKAGHTPAAAVTEKEKAATCTEDGSYDEVVYCSVCGTELSRNTIPVTALGHTPDAAVIEKEKAATCTDDGSYDEVVYCSVCDAELSRNTIPVTALGHDFKDTADKSKVAAAATCTTGTKYYVGCTVCDEVSATETWEDNDALDHSFTSGEYTYDTADDTHTQKCIRCDAYGAEADCEFSAWAEDGTSMHKRECVCGNTETGACVDNDPVVTPNTCTEGGYTTNTCETCNRVWKTDITSMKGHDFTGEYKINADGTHTFKCQNNCGEYGNATVCTYGAWVADAANRQHYRKCVCDRTETVDCIDKAEVTTVPATCLADEKTVYECQVCHNTWENVKAGTQKDHSYTGEYIKGNAATDIHQRKCVNGCGQYADEACKFTNNFKSAGDKVHTADCLCGNTQELNCPAMPVGMTDATCEDNAYMNYECEDCGNKWAIEQEDTALGHSYTNFVTVTPATCSQNGKKVATCDNGCGTTKSTVIPVDKNNHTGGTEVVGAFAATCQKEGYTGDTNCLACGNTIKVGTSIPVGDHDWDNGKTIREANCIGTGLKVYTCKVEGCGKTEEREVAVDPTNHADVQTGVGLDPTCTVPGYTGATECLACGTTIKTGTPIKELGHDIGPWEITVMPTEDGSVLGEAIRYCLRCGGERETKTGIAFEDVHLVIYHNYDGTRLTMPRYYITGDKTLRPEDEPIRVEDDQYTYKFIGWDFTDDQLNCVQMEMPVVAQYKATEKSYAVTFKDLNGKVIQTVPGNTPYSEIAKAYNGATPTKPSDAENNYVFSGWGIKCDYETGTAEVFPTFRKVPIKVEEEPNDGIFGWLIRWIKSLLAKIGIVL